MAKPLPAHADLITYNHAVAGHDGTLSDVDGELFIKPCTSAEIAFYEASVASHPAFAEFMPVFLGVLTLDQQLNGTSIEETTTALLARHHSHSHSQTGAPFVPDPCLNTNNFPLSASENGDAASSIVAKHSIPEVVVPNKVVGKRIATDQAVVLENAAHGFVKPNILDVKLGVRLWADDASEEKKIRFDKVTAETTHKDLGFRIAGMRVWQGENIASGNSDVDGEGYKIYDKNYGRYSVTTDNIEGAFKNFLFCKGAGVDEELGRLVAQAFLVEVQRIQQVLEEQESKMFSSSLLFVYEGDGKALRAAMEEASKSPPPSDLKVDNGDAATSAGAQTEESDDYDDDEAPLPKIFSVKVIDFAHAQWNPGQGPDENSLVGVRSVTNILEKIGRE